MVNTATAMKNDITDTPLWVPSEDKIKNAAMTKFMAEINQRYNKNFQTYQDLHQWSVENLGEFWSEIARFCNVEFDQDPTEWVANQDDILKARFAVGGKLNFAKHFLRRRDNETAIFFEAEDKVSYQLTFAELYDKVSQLAQYFKDQNIQPGDRIVGYLPNMPEAIIGMLAATSLGAVWSLASPDFGVQGVQDRFGQIEPKLFITTDGAYYHRKTVDSLSKVKEILPSLPTVEKTIVISLVSDKADISDLPNAVHWDDILGQYEPKDIDFTPVDFDHPLYILFSSGTTGKPKCMVHRTGGVLLQHLKEHILHCDVKPNDRLFYYTTTGWMMWHWLVSGLACGASLILYDGSPFYPNGNVLFDIADRYKMTLFGTAAKFIDALAKRNVKPAETHDLGSLKVLTSTGSPLVPESFDYIYQNIKSDLHVSSISGGSDIVSCFVLGNPISPVNCGEIQGAGLGIAIDIFDDNGKSLKESDKIGQRGELVCTKPFPVQPIGFWNDPENERYKNAYFNRFDNIWCHGDWVEYTKHNGYVIHGRSDATLNPGGVRIGTAEIYRQVEKHNSVMESVAVGQDWQGDMRIILFVRMQEEQELTDQISKEIKSYIRSGASPRHVPVKIIAVPDIPRTKSGKITELAIRDVIHGRDVKNKSALANAEALEFYKDIPELQDAAD